MALTRPKIWDIDTNIQYFMDPMTVLHQGATEANVDVGFLFNRANGLVSNVAIYWSESAQSFVTAFTSNSGATNSNISISNYANLTIGSLITLNTTGIVFDNNAGIILNNSSGDPGYVLTATGTGGLIWSAPGAFTGGILPNQLTANSGATSTSTTTGAIVVNGGVGISENLNVGGDAVILSTTVSSSTTTGALRVAGGVGIAGQLNVGANVTVSGTILPSANVTYNLGSHSYRWKDLYLSGTTIDLNGATISATNGSLTFKNSLGGSFAVTGSADGQSTGTFGNLIANSGITSTSTTTGALQITGGVGVSGNINIGGTVNNITGATSLGTVTAGSYQGIVGNVTPAAGTFTALTSQTTASLNTTTVASIQGPIGNATPNTGAFTTITASGTIIASGNIVAGSDTASTSTVTGALVVKGGAGITGDVFVGGTLTVANLQARGSSQLVVQDPMTYFQANVLYPWNFDTGLYSDSIGGPANAYVHHGMVRSIDNGYWGFFSNVKTEPNQTIEWANAGLIWDKVKAGELILANSTASTSTTTGALQVSGGAGISGNVYSGGNFTGAYGLYSTGAFNGGYSDGTVIDYTTGLGRISVGLSDALKFYTGGPASTETLVIASNGNIVIPASTTSTSTTTGALVVKGGVGVAGDLYTSNATTGAFTASRITGAGRSMTGQATLDLSALSATTYYPVTIPVPQNRTVTLRIENALNSNVPTWSTHGAGFSCFIEWTTNGSGWGTWPVLRRVNGWAEAYSSVTIVGGIGQMGNSSTEWIYLRGGGIYYFSADCDITPTIRTTTYTINSESVAPTTSITNSPWNQGSTSMSISVLYGKATSAQYADLAENYLADITYPPGTVLVFGGEQEVTVTDSDHNTAVAGIVSTNPAHLMNGLLTGSNVVALGLTGRLPCRVQGPVTKGDVLVTSKLQGVAQKIDNTKFAPGCVIGKCLESIATNEVATIEVVVGRF